MNSFVKQQGCPSSGTLSAYGAGTLSFLARPGVAGHLAACEFCGAELALLSLPRAVANERLEEPPSDPSAVTVAPPVPLALRLLAESLLPRTRAADAERRAA